MLKTTTPSKHLLRLHLVTQDWVQNSAGWLEPDFGCNAPNGQGDGLVGVIVGHQLLAIMEAGARAKRTGVVGRRQSFPGLKIYST